MGQTLSPETSAFKLQTPGKFPEEYKLYSEHGESLKTTKTYYFPTVHISVSHDTMGHAATPPHNKLRRNFTECFNINITLARII